MALAKQIDSRTLLSWIEQKKEFTLLDIRPLAQREACYIPESINVDVYEELKAGNVNALDGYNFNPLQPVVVFCAGGKLSVFAAQILSEKGVEAYSLIGGMDAWNTTRKG
jgi:rhodanese-related sulfurtransferase